MADIEPAAHVPTRVHSHGEMPAGAEAYAVAKVEAALLHGPGRALWTSVTLDSEAPGNRVDAHVHVRGTWIHVHAAGRTMQEATDLMQERLRARLRHLRRRPAQGPRPA